MTTSLLKATAPGLPRLTRQEQSVARAIAKAVAKIKSATSRAAVTRDLNENNVGAAIERIRWSEGEEFLLQVLPRQYRDAFDVAGHSAIKQLKVDTFFDVVNPRAVEFARTRSATLIKDFGKTSRAGIQKLIGRAMEEGLAPSKLGRMIVDAGIGLTEQGAAAVYNLGRALRDAGELFSSQIEFREGKYASSLLRDRGETIARTEMILASREGQQEAWEQAAESGFIDRSEMVQEWSVAEDERLCPTCSELDGKQAELGELFDGVYEGPPAHPRCRCSLIARFSRRKK